MREGSAPPLFDAIESNPGSGTVILLAGRFGHGQLALL